MEDNQQIKEAEIDLREVIAAVWAKMYLVILAAVIFGGLIYVFLSNRVYPNATPNKLAQMNIRTQIQSELYKSLKGNTKGGGVANFGN